MLDPLVLYCLLGCYALLFAIAGIEKLNPLIVFQAQLEAYDLVPVFLVPSVTRAVPVVELVAATLLITSAWQYGVWLGLMLLSGYCLAIWINLLRGRIHIDCGCLGSQGEGISYLHVARNLVMIALLALCLLPASDRELMWLDYLVIPVTLVAAALLYVTGSLLLSHAMNHRLWWSTNEQ